MAINTVTLRNTLVTAYKNTIVNSALYSTVPGATAGTELTGGSYARQPLTWGAVANSTVTSNAANFQVPAGATVAGVGLLDSGGTYQDGVGVTSQPFSTAGVYTITVSYTQT